jgi:demethylmenaquinone methyltransferase/2-methoxy-6-polyprenyl-1,4-benzoquinol methylase
VSDDKTTHFGYKTVAENEKAQKVAEVFHSVANRYDVMNDLMSAGLHRVWKRFLQLKANVRPGYRCLDIAGGTGDISRSAGQRCRPERPGLAHRHQWLDARRRPRSHARRRHDAPVAQCDAEKLPFPEAISIWSPSPSACAT